MADLEAEGQNHHIAAIPTPVWSGKKGLFRFMAGLYQEHLYSHTFAVAFSFLGRRAMGRVMSPPYVERYRDTHTYSASRLLAPQIIDHNSGQSNLKYSLPNLAFDKTVVVN